MHGIALHVGAEVAANGAGGGFVAIGRADKVAQLRYGLVALTIGTAGPEVIKSTNSP